MMMCAVSDLSRWEAEVITLPEGDFDSHPVTEDNRELAQRCAVAAVVAPFAITPIYEE